MPKLIHQLFISLQELFSCPHGELNLFENALPPVSSYCSFNGTSELTRSPRFQKLAGFCPSTAYIQECEAKCARASWESGNSRRSWSRLNWIVSVVTGTTTCIQGSICLLRQKGVDGAIDQTDGLDVCANERRNFERCHKDYRSAWDVKKRRSRPWSDCRHVGFRLRKLHW